MGPIKTLALSSYLSDHNVSSEQTKGGAQRQDVDTEPAAWTRWPLGLPPTIPQFLLLGTGGMGLATAWSQVSKLMSGTGSKSRLGGQAVRGWP